MNSIDEMIKEAEQEFLKIDAFLQSYDELPDSMANDENLAKVVIDFYDRVAVVGWYKEHLKCIKEINELYEQRKNAKGDDIAKLDEEISKYAEDNKRLLDFNGEIKARFADAKNYYDEYAKRFPVTVMSTEEFYNSIKKNDAKWDPRLTEEQILDAYQRDIYEPVGREYEMFLSDLGLKPLENEGTKVSPTPQWDPRLTEEQILDAYQRDIYEPVGREYEMFLSDLGLKPINKDNTQPVEEEIERPAPKKVEPKKEDEVVDVQPERDDSNIILPGVPTPQKEEEEEKEEEKPVLEFEEVEEKREVNTLESVLYEISKDTNLTRFGRKALVNSEIKVAKNIANKFKQNGNWIYNISYVVPSVVTGLFGVVKKIGGQIYNATHLSKKVDLNLVRDRLRELPKNKLEILRTQFDLGRANENSGYNAIAPLIYERLIEYVETEYCQPRREELKALYKDVADRYARVNALLYKEHKLYKNTDPESQKEIEKIEQSFELLSDGCSEEIARIDQLRQQISHYYNDGIGMQSLSTAYGAVDNNSNRKGRMFAKKYSTAKAEAFNGLLSEFSKRRARAVANRDDFDALIYFGDEENLKIKNTRVKKSIFGKRSVGIYNYNPIPRQEEIGPDPLMSYIMRTVATIGIAKGIISEIQNQFIIAPQLREAGNAIADHNKMVNDANNFNLDLIQQVKEYGKQLSDKGADYKAGLEGIGRQGILDKQSGGEYSTIGLDNGNFGANYHAFDSINHAETHELMDSFNATLNHVDSGLSNGSMSMSDAISTISSELTKIQAAKQGIYSKFNDVLNTSPITDRFDYEAFAEYIPKVMNDNSLLKMSESMIESVKAGEALKTAAVQFAPELSVNIPTHIQSFIIPLITEAALLTYIENATKKYLTLYKNDEDIEDIIDKFKLGDEIHNRSMYEIENEINEKEESTRER